jgi:hypothetical protein
MTTPNDVPAFKVGQFSMLECKCGDIRHGFSIQIAVSGQVFVNCRSCDAEMYMTDVMEVLNRYNEYK